MATPQYKLDNIVLVVTKAVEIMLSQVLQLRLQSCLNSAV